MTSSSVTSKQKLSVSIIIPALNEAVMLERLLDSIAELEENTNISILETIVVDAQSSDDTVAIARAHQCRIIQATPGNVAVSRNLGAANAVGNLIAFVDADCELPHTWLLEAHKLFDQGNIVAVGARMASNPNTTSWVERAWYELAHRQNSNQSSSEVSWLPSFNLLVRKAVFEQAGGFNESLVTCEDTELGYRLAKLGGLRRIEIVGVIHHGESRTIREFYRREAWRSRGAVQILRNYWKDTRELLSFLLPFFIIGGNLTAIMLLLGSVLYRDYAVPLTSLAFSIGFIPLALLMMQRKMRLRHFAPCALLFIVYFYARCRGTISPFNRVERT